MYEPIKSLGQNFLMRSSTVNRMLEALELSEHEDIIEIGPGHGILTESLAAKVRERDIKVYCVEIDERFAQKLYRMYAYETQIEVINEDILKWLPKFTPERKIKILGSLPYYITSPIIHTIIKMQTQPELAVVLIQKEVAEKICSQAPDATYLSSFVQTFYETKYLFKVPKDEFKPEPKVDGAVIKLVRNDTEMSSEMIEKFEGFLHRAFSHPRKMLNKPFTKEELEKGGIDPKLRPQNLSSSEWLDFYKILQTK